jgi:hypothetical protein
MGHTSGGGLFTKGPWFAKIKCFGNLLSINPGGRLHVILSIQLVEWGVHDSLEEAVALALAV